MNAVNRDAGVALATAVWCSLDSSIKEGDVIYRLFHILLAIQLPALTEEVYHLR